MTGPNRKLISAAAAASIGLVAALGLGGCATTAGHNATASSEGPTRSDLYVYQVDRAAERNGVRVIWVHPPKGGEALSLGYSLEATVGDEDDSDG